MTAQWFILKTKSNFEKKVFDQLSSKGFETYLPIYSTVRIWSDRKKKVEVPLIPSYVFVHCLENELLEAAKTNGVAWIMKERRNNAVVKDYEIENIRIYLSESNMISNEPVQDFEEGQDVKVIRGPFKGLQGISLHRHSEYRVRIEISSLGTNFTVNVPKSQLEKI